MNQSKATLQALRLAHYAYVTILASLGIVTSIAVYELVRHHNDGNLTVLVINTTLWAGLTGFWGPMIYQDIKRSRSRLNRYTVEMVMKE